MLEYGQEELSVCTIMCHENRGHAEDGKPEQRAPDGVEVFGCSKPGATSEELEAHILCHHTVTAQSADCECDASGLGSVALR